MCLCLCVYGQGDGCIKTPPPSTYPACTFCAPSKVGQGGVQAGVGQGLQGSNTVYMSHRRQRWCGQNVMCIWGCLLLSPLCKSGWLSADAPTCAGHRAHTWLCRGWEGHWILTNVVAKHEGWYMHISPCITSHCKDVRLSHCVLQVMCIWGCLLQPAQVQLGWLSPDTPTCTGPQACIWLCAVHKTKVLVWVVAKHASWYMLVPLCVTTRCMAVSCVYGLLCA
jgi:hypothetical protein